MAAGGQPLKHPFHDDLAEQVVGGKHGISVQPHLVTIAGAGPGPVDRHASAAKHHRSRCCAMPAGGAGRVVLALGADLGGQLGVQQPTHHRRPTATLLASSPPWRCWRCRPWPGAARRAAQPGWRRPRGQRGGQVASAWRSPPVGVLGGTPDTSHAAGLRRGHRHLNLNKPGDNLGRFRRSRSTVWVEVKCSPGVQLSALFLMVRNDGRFVISSSFGCQTGHQLQRSRSLGGRDVPERSQHLLTGLGVAGVCPVLEV